MPPLTSIMLNLNLRRNLLSKNIKYYSTTPKPIAFAFDVDGVLKLGKNVIPEAKIALDKLNSLNVPFIFITNGGGVKEYDKVKELSRSFNLNFDENQLVLSHTVMKSLTNKFKNDNILVIGGEENGEICREIAKGYGFNNVFVPNDILYWNRHIYPFATPVPHPDGLPLPHTFLPKHADFSNLSFKAALVFKDNENWGLDIQILCDLLRSRNGVIGTETDNDQQGIELHCSNPDKVWSTEYPLPRHGQGMFIEALKAVHNNRSPNIKFNYTQYGKPTIGTYQYADNLLKHLFNQKTNINQKPQVIMVGDNPDSDIQGANNFGWKSALVRTGIYNKGEPNHKPSIIVDNVLKAVEWGLSLSHA